MNVALEKRMNRMVEQARQRTEASEPCTKCQLRNGWHRDHRGRCNDCAALCTTCDERPQYKCTRCAPCYAASHLDVCIPQRFSTATMEQVRSAHSATVIEPLERFLTNDTVTGAVLLGPVGIGKTFSACALGRAYITANPTKTFDFTTVSYLLEQLRPDRDDLLHWQSMDLLVLDDLGRERLTEWAAETLFLVVDDRWQSGRRTIVTSNFEPAALISRVGDAVMDRLLDGAIGVRFAGKSMRAMAA